MSSRFSSVKLKWFLFLYTLCYIYTKLMVGFIGNWLQWSSYWDKVTSKSSLSFSPSNCTAIIHDVSSKGIIYRHHLLTGLRRFEPTMDTTCLEVKVTTVMQLTLSGSTTIDLVFMSLMLRPSSSWGLRQDKSIYICQRLVRMMPLTLPTSDDGITTISAISVNIGVNMFIQRRNGTNQGIVFWPEGLTKIKCNYFHSITLSEGT